MNYFDNDSVSNQCITATLVLDIPSHRVIDFLTKPIDDVALFAAIEKALRRDIEQRSERAIRHGIEQRPDELTVREREVMVRIVRGRLNKQIAGEFGVGEKTVKVHRARVMSNGFPRSRLRPRSLEKRTRGTCVGTCISSASVPYPPCDRPTPDTL
jgi:FixJ family two-component response regulator